MLKAIELENVRLFEGAGWKFDLLPLTVFCGTNSSGKSTLLKSLLLLRQSQGIRESYGYGQGKLRFVGSQVDLGGYDSFVSHNDTSKDVGISLTIEDKIHASFKDSLLSSSIAHNGNSSSPSEEQEEQLLPYSLKASFRFGVIEHNTLAQVSKLMPNEAIEETDCSQSPVLLKQALFEVCLENKELLSWKVEANNSSEDHKTGYTLTTSESYFEREPLLKMMDVKIVESRHEAMVSTLLYGLIPGRILVRLPVQPFSENGKSNTSERWSIWPLPPHLEEILRDFVNALANINYLGPLRSPPQRYAVTHLDTRPPLDPTGEFLPYILKDTETRQVSYVPPGQTSEAKQGKFSQALNSWLYYIRTGEEPEASTLSDEIEIETTKVLVEFRVKNVCGNQSHALSDSGFGYSQILPILVRGLLLSKGSTLIVEQPELHLNPALQVRLAEFFVSMIRAGKQVLIETHSEHIVNMIRVLAAEDESGELATKCGLFFIDAQGTCPKVHDLSIQPNGNVPDWPREFFGEAASLAGRLLRAQRRFRTQRKQRRVVA